MATELDTTEAWQGPRLRVMLFVLVLSLALAVIAGLMLAVGLIGLPPGGTP